MGDLLLGLKFGYLAILSTQFIHFVQDRLKELRPKVWVGGWGGGHTDPCPQKKTRAISYNNELPVTSLPNKQT